uniref:NADP-dependent oxidoreductase domain-containing protein n=2 Tax=Clastoptera arizonana TaxID=38151 RepID=A0A1B6D3P7_9HEMI
MTLPETYVEGFHDIEAVKKMKYIKFGNTGLLLSKLSLGCGVLGNAYGDFDESEAISTVKEAFKLGINYVDTSPYYGDTKSETILGKALKEIPREAYYISTKVGRYGSVFVDMFDQSAERITIEFENSLKRLGLDYVDILIIHDIEFTPLSKILNEAIPAAESIIKKGKAKYLGISGYPVSNLWEVIEKSSVPIQVMFSYSRDLFFDSTLKTYLPFLQGKGVSVFNSSVTGLSLLTNHGPYPWHPASDELKQICSAAAEYCKTHNVELGNLAAHYALSQQNYSTTVIGMNTKKLLRTNLEILYNGLSEEELKVYQEIRQKFFNTGENLHWEGVEIKALHKALQEKTKA